MFPIKCANKTRPKMAMSMANDVSPMNVVVVRFCPYELKKKPEKKVLYKRIYRERGCLPSFSLFFLHGIFFIIVSINIWHDEHAVVSTGLYINMWNYDQNWEKDVISNAKLWKHCWQLRLASYCGSPWLKKIKKSPRALDTK